MGARYKGVLSTSDWRAKDIERAYPVAEPAFADATRLWLVAFDPLIPPREPPVPLPPRPRLLFDEMMVGARGGGSDVDVVVGSGGGGGDDAVASLEALVSTMLMMFCLPDDF